MLNFTPSIQPTVHGLNINPQHSLGVEKETEQDAEKETASKTEPSDDSKKETNQLSQSDQLKVQQLKRRDIEVKAHEQAHLSAAGSLAQGGAHYTYTKGPNGVRYATGGEVHIDTSPVEGDPAATILKAENIKRAALAPASPSAQDRQVASKATAMAQSARADLIQLTQEAENNTNNPDNVDGNTESTQQPIVKPSPGSFIDLTV